MSPAAVTTSGKGLQLTLQPNPASDEVTVTYLAGQKARTEIRLTDISGVEVYRKTLGDQRGGDHKIQLGHLASGIYMVELTSGTEKVVQRLVKE
jgi:hypothetical protein